MVRAAGAPVAIRASHPGPRVLEEASGGTLGINVQTGTTLTFDRFWTWLKDHANCILRAGTQDTWMFDSEELHWHFEADARHNPTVQLIQGKKLLAEIVMDVRDVMFVQA